LFAGLDRRTAQVLAVEFEQIEGAEHRGRAMPLTAYEFENRKSPPIANVCLTVDHAHWRREVGNAKAMKGKRLVKLLLLRV